MRRINVGAKTGVDFLTLLIVLLVTGGASYWNINTLQGLPPQ
jgi:hypothetical protein